MSMLDTLVLIVIVITTWTAIGAIYIVPKLKGYAESGQRLTWYETVTCLPWVILTNLSSPANRE